MKQPGNKRYILRIRVSYDYDILFYVFALFARCPTADVYFIRVVNTVIRT